MQDQVTGTTFDPDCPPIDPGLGWVDGGPPTVPFAQSVSSLPDSLDEWYELNPDCPPVDPALQWVDGRWVYGTPDTGLFAASVDQFALDPDCPPIDPALEWVDGRPQTVPFASSVDQLVQAMAGFAAPAPGQTTLTPTGQQALQPVLAASLQ